MAVHLRVFWPISPISATQEPRVILGFRDGARGLRTTQTALSGHGAPLRRYERVPLSGQECWNLLYAPTLSLPQGSKILKGRGEYSMVGGRRG
jgi:hypothetical protein